MINVILPIAENPEKFCDLVERESKSGVRFFIGARQSLAELVSTNLKGLKGVELHVFADNAGKEEIINALSACKMSKGKILIARRALTNEEFEKLISSPADIARLASKHNKFVAWLKNLGKMIVKKVFAFTFFDDISAICYAESMFNLISVCPNVSMASRINKYVGVQIEDVQTQEKQVKKDYNRFVNALIFTLWTLFLAGSVAGGTLVGMFVSSRALIVILLMFWIVVALMCWLVALVNFIRTLSVGNLRYGKAHEVESQFAIRLEEEMLKTKAKISQSQKEKSGKKTDLKSEKTEKEEKAAELRKSTAKKQTKQSASTKQKTAKNTDISIDTEKPKTTKRPQSKTDSKSKAAQKKKQVNGATESVTKSAGTKKNRKTFEFKREIEK